MDEAKYLADSGTKEIILLGQNVNAYNNEKYRLSDIILKLEKLSGIKRIRYTTSHPKDMTDDLIEASIKSSVMSFGWDVVYLILLMPESFSSFNIISDNLYFSLL